MSQKVSGNSKVSLWLSEEYILSLNLFAFLSEVTNIKSTRHYIKPPRSKPLTDVASSFVTTVNVDVQLVPRYFTPTTNLADTSVLEVDKSLLCKN